MLLGEVRVKLCCKDCITGERAGRTGPHPRSWIRRGARFSEWFVPSAILVLLPKCPLCIAGYLTVATGIGISVTTAAYAKMAFTVVCVASLLYLGVKRALYPHS